MAFDEPWYVESRAESYAILQLTERADVSVSRLRGIPGLDLLLSLGDGILRSCGVAIVPRAAAEEPARIGPERIEREQEVFRQVAFPVFMVSFAAEEPAGEFRWIAEPQVQMGRPFLALNPSGDFQPLTDDLLARVFAQIDEWYERRADQVRRVPVDVSNLSHELDLPRQRRAG